MRHHHHHHHNGFGERSLLYHQQRQRQLLLSHQLTTGGEHPPSHLARYFCPCCAKSQSTTWSSSESRCSSASERNIYDQQRRAALGRVLPHKGLLHGVSVNTAVRSLISQWKRCLTALLMQPDAACCLTGISLPAATARGPGNIYQTFGGSVCAIVLLGPVYLWSINGLLSNRLLFRNRYAVSA